MRSRPRTDPGIDPGAAAPGRSAPGPAALAGRRYRLTVRTRLALTYCALLVGAGAVMLGIVYFFMRYVPTYDLAGPMVPSESSAAVGEATPGPSPLPVPGGDGIPAESTVPATEILITSTDQLLDLLLIVSCVVLVVLAVVGIGVGWAVAGRMLKPLQYINAAVHHAAQGDLRQRIELTGPRDEISDLAANVDDMLAQLERSFAASRRFAANASHELRTPLATTRAMLDVELARHPDPDERQVFDRLRTMNERSIETVEALLSLARIDSSTVAPEVVDLPRAVGEVVELCAGEAAERGVRIDCSLDPAEVDAEPVLVRQLLTNLVTNAIRHNVETDGFLTIATSTAGPRGEVTVEVTNSGRVLDPDQVAALTEPFARAQGRVSAGGAHGHGLGLSIVSAIVDRMHGELALEPRPAGGLRVVVTFPARET